MRAEMWVYSYEHIDEFLPRIEFAPDDEPFGNVWRVIGGVVMRWAGWEGDGEIGVMQIPPFCFPRDYNYCTYVLHVKQRNNGTSWIACFRELPFDNDCLRLEGVFAIPEEMTEDARETIDSLKAEKQKRAELADFFSPCPACELERQQDEKPN